MQLNLTTLEECFNKLTMYLSSLTPGFSGEFRESQKYFHRIRLTDIKIMPGIPA